MTDIIKNKAQEFIRRQSGLDIPEGQTRQKIEAEAPGSSKPMLALLTFLHNHHTSEDDHDISELVIRTNSNTGLPNAIVSTAIGDELPAGELRDSIRFGDQDIFKAMIEMAKNIFTERLRALQDDPAGTTLKHEKESSDQALPPADESNLTPEELAIRREARQYDREHHKLSDTAIHKTAEEGYPTYDPDQEEPDRYHKREKGREHVAKRQLEAAFKEARDYLELSEKLHDCYKATLGTLFTDRAEGRGR